MILLKEMNHKPVPGFDGEYSITDCGKVFGHKRSCFRVVTFAGKGYGQVTLTRGKIRKEIAVHRLVAELFVYNPNPEKLNQVNHIDLDKTNNHYSNLEWVDCTRNMRYMTPTKKRSRTRSFVAIDPDGNECIYYSIADFASATGMRYDACWQLVDGRLSHHHGYTVGNVSD